MAAGIVAPLIPTIIEGLFTLGDKALAKSGRRKEAAAAMLRVQEADLRGVAATIDGMVKADSEVNRETLALLGQLVGRSADIADAAADTLVGDDDAPGRR